MDTTTTIPAGFAADVAKRVVTEKLSPGATLCRGCKSPTPKCANCHGAGQNKKSQQPCRACKGRGYRTFCGNRGCGNK